MVFGTNHRPSWQAFPPRFFTLLFIIGLLYLAGNPLASQATSKTARMTHEQGTTL